MKVALYPLSRALFKSQQKVLILNNKINPKLQDIKNSYNGEDRHFKVLEMYKKLDISPNYKLYPALIALIQIPILISIFNTLGEMPQVSAQKFLWIADLSRPDMMSFLPFSIPFLGNSFNFLPLLMSIFVFLSGFLYTEGHPDTYQKKNKIKQSFFMATIFFVIFYPFPASMVLYWTASNFFNIAQQKMFFPK
jgi:YidC/Oxa1 family membrane protein insertase